MTPEQFREQALDLILKYMQLVYQLALESKIEPEQKRKMIATTLSLLLYAQEELNALSQSSEASISEQ